MLPRAGKALHSVTAHLRRREQWKALESRGQGRRSTPPRIAVKTAPSGTATADWLVYVSPTDRSLLCDARSRKSVSPDCRTRTEEAAESAKRQHDGLSRDPTSVVAANARSGSRSFTVTRASRSGDDAVTEGVYRHSGV